MPLHPRLAAPKAIISPLTALAALLHVVLLIAQVMPLPLQSLRHHSPLLVAISS